MSQIMNRKTSWIILLPLTLFLLLTIGRLAAAEPHPFEFKKDAAAKAMNSYRTDIVKISYNIQELIVGGHFQEAEKELETLLSSRQMNENGVLVLEPVYTQLSISTPVAALDKWCEASPGSNYPFTVRGIHYLQKAEALGGSAVGALLSSRDRNTYNRAIIAAGEDLQKAYSLNDRNPAAPACMVLLSLMRGLPAADMEMWFDRAVAADPAWLSSYRAKLQYLSPYRFGSDQKMLLFAVQCLRAENNGSSLYTLFLEYLEIKLRSIANNIAREQFLLKPDIYTLLRECVERYQVEFPKSPAIAVYERLLSSALANPYEAITAFSETLAYDPDDISARKGRIDAYILTGQYEKAVEDAMTLLIVDPNSWFALSRLGHIWFAHRNEPDIGEGYYNQALAHAPGSYLKATMLFTRGQHFSLLGMHRRAIRDYSQALNIDPLYEKAYIARAEDSYRIGNRDEALNDLLVVKSVLRGRLANRAKTLINRYLRPETTPDTDTVGTAKAPSDKIAQTAVSPLLSENKPDESSTGDEQILTRTYFNKGLQLFYDSKFRKAALMFSRILSLNQSHPGAFYMLGEISERTGKKPETASLYFRHAYMLDKNNAQYRLAYTRNLFQQGFFSRAHSILTNPTIEGTLTPAEYYLRALCRQKLNRIQDAVEDAAMSLKLDNTLSWSDSFPDRLEIRPARYKEVIATDPEQNHPATAQQQMEAEPVPSRGSTEAESKQLTEKARTLIDQDNLKEAKIQLFEAVQHDPFNSAPFYLLGNLFVKEGHLRKAVLYFTQAIERDHSVADYFSARGQTLFNLEEFESAERDYTAALQLIPGEPELLYMRGNTRLKMGHMEDARRDFDMIRADSKN